MRTPKLREVKCTECYKIMQPVWQTEPPHYLSGWVCDCCNAVPAIMREKKFKRDEHGGEKRSV